MIRGMNDGERITFGQMRETGVRVVLISELNVGGGNWVVDQSPRRDILAGCHWSTILLILKISAGPQGGIDEWQWTLSSGNDAPIESGVVKGSRMDGIRAVREERMRLIARAVEPPDNPLPKRGTGSVE